jgi:hypothetical protein
MGPLISITEDDVWFEWAKAEIPQRHAATAPPDLATKLTADEPLTAEERQRAIDFMKNGTERSLPPGAAWFRTTMPLIDIGDILVDGYWLFLSLVQGWPGPFPLTLKEFAENTHVTAQTVTLDGKFKFAKARGAIILIGVDEGGPWVIAEGSNRLRGMWRSRGNDDAPAEIGVIVGVHPWALGHWNDRDVPLALRDIEWSPQHQLGFRTVITLVNATNGKTVEITPECPPPSRRAW